jgi:dipeptidyl aminopeptidase/acylaminoacyl peptidase
MLAIGLFACSRSTVDRSDLARELTRHLPSPLLISPDGKRVLDRAMSGDRFALEVHNVTGGVVARTDARTFHLAMTWRADGNAIAYLAPSLRDGLFRPYLWSLAPAAAPRGVTAPPTAWAAEMLYAPRGGRFAYVVTPEIGKPLDLVVVAPHQEEERYATVFRNLSMRAGFAWSPDGTRLAVVGASDEGSVVIVSASGGPAQRVTVVPGGLVREMSWRPDGNALAVSARAPDEEHYSIHEVSLASGDRRLLARPDDLTGPVYTPNGRLLLQESSDGDARLLCLDAPGVAPRTLGDKAASSWAWLGFDATGDTAYYRFNGSFDPPSIVAVAIGAGTLRTVAESQKVEGVVGQRRRLASTGGVEVPVVWWPATHAPGQPRRAVVFAHGGPEAQMTPGWDAGIQMLARSGLDVVAVNYRGSIGYGTRFERIGPVGGRIDDVLAGAAFARDRNGPGSAEVELWGSSYGASLAATAASRHPEAFTRVVLASFQRALGPPGAPAGGPPVAAFQGAHDFYPVEQARAQLLGLFGPPRLAARHGGFNVLPAEGHNFHSPATWAEVYGALLDR